ncbi:MAG: hypothetical protein LQ347_006231 [Umbilicaria vellea]|nr:MAG: hypothetical protein LQ347_006231 [Umbilicaria vellea]
MAKALLITCATGKQGEAVISALHDLPESKQFTILALTRSPTSASAQSLCKKYPEVKCIAGDLNDCPAIFESAVKVAGVHNVWGVFSVQSPFGAGATTDTEEKQGKALVDASLAADVQHFVYSSVDRGGKKSDNDPTSVPHFISKHNVEKHLESKCSDDGKMQYTILRPTAFMENITPDFMGKVFPAMWIQTLAPSRKLHLISTKDIGWFAAQAFLNPDEYKGQKISLAGDELTLEEAKVVFKQVIGRPMPTTWGFLGSVAMYMIGDLGAIFRWINKVGFDVDFGSLKKTHPQLETFRDWVARPENGFAGK